MVKDNYNDIMDKVNKSITISNRKLDEVVVVGVTKTVSVEKIKELYDAGIKTFGENRVQELLPKIEALPKDISWHFIGTLQSNKVKQIVGKVDLIQSVDSFKLLDEINKCAKNLNIIQNILLEINIGLEESKSGINQQDLSLYLDYCKNLENIKVKGLMCIPPNLTKDGKIVDNLENLRKMRKIFVDNMGVISHNICMNVLSMGMSSDFQDAIIEGSTMVRIGQAFFGEREKILN